MKRLFFCLVVLLLSVQAAVAQNPRSERKCFEPAEIMPSFPGGTKALMDFIAANLKYPAEYAENCIQGRVVVSFSVNPDSTCTDFKVVHSVDSLLDAEALRVLKLMPKWNPGSRNGRPVKVRYAVPVTFRLLGPTPYSYPMKWPKTANSAKSR
ncbi:energy transducer TonB [Prevotella sp. kh1p2]|uniref:energy transducer TonB n=1 Tax=Prevotella sp. kh1p2 TaxID=1761883 RepID=UPI0008D6361D|nr:energy transducer TonB [Prevotella sp. kh1p2]SES83047.1 TonB family C-terminal domain-containing protein [Prevotella sp. kh1p2]SNU10832.1 TonB family C-terminal domain-containing protein [Prevotellaceae bacterium KH2P17]